MTDRPEDLIKISRRRFLSGSTAGLMLSGGSFSLLNSLMTQEAKAGTINPAADGNRLVVLQLDGANDTLNTIVPYGHEESDIYYAERPNLGIRSTEVLDIDGTFGFHPVLTEFKGLWDSSDMAMLHGVGYPEPNLSHFKSTDKWLSANPSGQATEGWLGRFFDLLAADGDLNPLLGVEFAPKIGLAFGGGEGRTTLFRDGNFSLETAQLALPGSAERLQRILRSDSRGFSRSSDSPMLKFVRTACEEAVDAAEINAGIPVLPAESYPESDLGRDFKRAAEMIHADLPTKVFYLKKTGFDNHAGQIESSATTGVHASLLQDVSDSIGAFAADMKDAGLWDNTLIMVFSEFSRKVIENGGFGTDHGAGQSLFFLGGRVNAGMHGIFPSMAAPARVRNDSLDFSTDFRRVYRTILERWLGVDAASIPTLLPDAPTDFSHVTHKPELT